jgi:predicted O-methyltransferase YrrM
MCAGAAGLTCLERFGQASAERSERSAWTYSIFYAAQPEEFQTHDQAMRAISAAQVRAVLGVIDFSRAGTVVDVGGGTGELLSAILAANGTLKGILFDLPHVVAHAEPVLADRGVVDRIQAVGGDFLEGIPSGGDTLLLKTVLHNWDDARAAAILRNCRSAISPTGKLLIIERELPEIGQVGQSEEAFLLDLEMLVMTPGGRERTREEFAKLLSDTQFELVRVVPTESPVSIFEAQPT